MTEQEGLRITNTGVPTGTLRYPKALDDNSTDYVVFRHMEYRTNKRYESQEPNITENPSPPPTGNVITLYMPNSTPQVGNGQKWAGQTFGGPMGETFADFGQQLAGGVMNVGTEGGPGAGAAGEAIARQIEELWNGRGADFARHWALDQVGKATAGSANNLLAMQRGEIYNPNVELLYQSPQLREFSFNFNFLPKSQGEAQTVNEIIREFKVWSTPEAAGSMYKLPHVWEINYMSNGSVNKNMNKFKKCALTGVSIKANANQDMHMAFPDGMPVSTSMSLKFMEVDFITRQDQENTDTNQGY